jgi:hypothetical protein
MPMARKHNVNPILQREARQQLFDASPMVSNYPGVGEIAIELTFSDPEGKQRPSARGLLFGPDMRAYFHFACPMRDCTGGGFDPSGDLLAALSKRRNGHTGAAACKGVRPRGGVKTQPCGIELHYTMAIRKQAVAA